MTPAASILEPDSNPALYVSRGADPLRRPAGHSRCAPALQTSARPAVWFDRGVPLPWSRPLSCWPPSAAWRGPPTCRHCRASARWPTSSPSSRNSWNIPLPDGYLQYLRLKLRSIVDKADPATVQKTTFSDDR